MALNLVHQGAHDILAQNLIGFFNNMVFVIIFSLEFNQFIVGIVLMVRFMPVDEMNLIKAS